MISVRDFFLLWTNIWFGMLDIFCLISGLREASLNFGEKDFLSEFILEFLAF